MGSRRAARSEAIPRGRAGGNLGILGHNEFLLAFAFPLDQGHLEPMFVAGMNF